MRRSGRAGARVRHWLGLYSEDLATRGDYPEDSLDCPEDEADYLKDYPEGGSRPDPGPLAGRANVAGLLMSVCLRNESTVSAPSSYGQRSPSSVSIAAVCRTAARAPTTGRTVRDQNRRDSILTVPHTHLPPSSIAFRDAERQCLSKDRHRLFALAWFVSFCEETGREAMEATGEDVAQFLVHTASQPRSRRATTGGNRPVSLGTMLACCDQRVQSGFFRVVSVRDAALLAIGFAGAPRSRCAPRQDHGGHETLQRRNGPPLHSAGGSVRGPRRRSVSVATAPRPVASDSADSSPTPGRGLCANGHRSSPQPPQR